MMQLVTGVLVVGLLAMAVFQGGCDANRGAGKAPGQAKSQPPQPPKPPQPSQPSQPPQPPKLAEPAKQGNPVVVMETSEGTIRIELNADQAPISVQNFLQYVDEKFYDGTIFHRVIDGFMIQGGGFTPEMRKKPTRQPIKNEAANGLANDRGTIAMARTNVVDSATAQFYINVADNQALNHSPQSYGYAVFGRVIDGLDVVDRIRTVRTGTVAGMQNVPLTPVVIKTIRRASGD